MRALTLLCAVLSAAISMTIVSTPALAREPSDPLTLPYQWHLRPFPALGTTPSAAGLDLPGAWDITRGTAYVGVVDNGIDLSSVELTKLPGVLRYYPHRPQFAANVVQLPGIAVDASNVDERMFPVDPDLAGIHVASTAAGHGTHVASLIAGAASDPADLTSGTNPDSDGTSSVCWRCSLIVAKYNDTGIRRINDFDETKLFSTARAFNHALDAGAQVINFSSGVNPGRAANTSDYCSNLSTPRQASYDAMCDALAKAVLYQVPIVAAAGNDNLAPITSVRPGDRWSIDFPASDPRAIAVGGVATHGRRWAEPEDSTTSSLGSNRGIEMRTHGVVAPARDVVSAIYRLDLWSNAARCGDGHQMIPGDPTTAFNGDGYGPCTGTSMATPLVSGIVAMMRSVDPLASAQVVKQRLLSSSSNAAAPSDERGYGVPSARIAVQEMKVTNPVLLTPLFSLLSSTTGKRFYTTVPQMARAALLDTLLPKPANGAVRQYAPATASQVQDPATGALYEFPGTSGVVATADVWVHSTYRAPNYNYDLIPLHRFSRSVDGVVDHAYAAGRSTAVGELLLRQYQLDGIEGYLHPMSVSQPPGSVRLLSASKDPGLARDFAVFPENKEAMMRDTYGYLYGTTALGYAYANVNGQRPTPTQPQPPEPIETRPLAPFGITPNWDRCYGRYRLEWAPASGNATWFDVERRIWGTPSTAWNRIYQGAQTVVWYDVGTQTMDFRVRACNIMGCSAYTNGMSAWYVPQCPNP